MSRAAALHLDGVFALVVYGLITAALAVTFAASYLRPSRPTRSTPGGTTMVPSRTRLYTGVGLLTLAALVGAVGWYKISGEPALNRQVPLLASAGMAVVLLSVAGGALLVADQLRGDDRRLDDLETAVTQLAAALAPSIESPPRLRGTTAVAGTPAPRAAAAPKPSPAAEERARVASAQVTPEPAPVPPSAPAALKAAEPAKAAAKAIEPTRADAKTTPAVASTAAAKKPAEAAAKTTSAVASTAAAKKPAKAAAKTTSAVASSAAAKPAKSTEPAKSTQPAKAIEPVKATESAQAESAEAGSAEQTAAGEPAPAVASTAAAKKPARKAAAKVAPADQPAAKKPARKTAKKAPAKKAPAKKAAAPSGSFRPAGTTREVVAPAAGVPDDASAAEQAIAPASLS